MENSSIFWKLETDQRPESFCNMVKFGKQEETLLCILWRYMGKMRSRAGLKTEETNEVKPKEVKCPQRDGSEADIMRAETCPASRTGKSVLNQELQGHIDD